MSCLSLCSFMQRVSGAFCVVAFGTHTKEEEHIAPAASTAATTATALRANRRTTKSVLHLFASNS